MDDVFRRVIRTTLACGDVCTIEVSVGECSDSIWIRGFDGSGDIIVSQAEIEPLIETLQAALPHVLKDQSGSGSA